MTDKTPNIGEPIAEFTFQATDSSSTSFSQYKGKNLVLYFYPKDNTPGCTQEAKDFRDLYPKFLAANTEILGVSRDSLKSHHSFKESCELPFPLISDGSEALCHYFGVIKLKTFYGIKKLGLERSTFLIDDKGILRGEWRNVNVKGHVQEVFSECEGVFKRKTL